MQVDPNDPDSVLWLQQSLARVIAGRIHIEPTGHYDTMTRKAVETFQRRSALPVTGEVDLVTVQRIEQELEQLDQLGIKKKQGA